jgi:hypothetical protein
MKFASEASRPNICLTCKPARAPKQEHFSNRAIGAILAWDFRKNGAKGFIRSKQLLAKSYLLFLNSETFDLFSIFTPYEYSNFPIRQSLFIILHVAKPNHESSSAKPLLILWIFTRRSQLWIFTQRSFLYLTLAEPFHSPPGGSG